MIAALIQYRYLAIILATLAALVGLWLWGVSRYYEGYEACEASVQSASFAAQENSIKGANNVRKKEQSLDKKRVIAGLSGLGIRVRDYNG
jgi:hypothetical protein